jgi:hypothetical protein
MLSRSRNSTSTTLTIHVSGYLVVPGDPHGLIITTAVFNSPLPNKQLWHNNALGSLQAPSFMTVGGWWHNPRILAAVGEGEEIEEPRAWKGCWNEHIVELVRLSMQDESTLTVLLTGRSEHGFLDLLARITKSHGLEFDMLCLKPRSGPDGEAFDDTMEYKQALLKQIVFTYTKATELRIYEDRPKHVQAFQNFFDDLNRILGDKTTPESALRPPFTAAVVHVNEEDCHISPEIEVAEVQRMINANNTAVRDGTAPSGTVPHKITRSILYTGYLIRPTDSARLLSLLTLPKDCDPNDIRNLANNILIAPRPAAPHILKRVGGIGAQQRWRVTGYAHMSNRVWAARVEPRPPNSVVYTENRTPYVVLATRKQSKPIEANMIRNWQPVSAEQAIEFETVVGEKILLKIEEEENLDHINNDKSRDHHTGQANARKGPKKRSYEEDYPALGTGAPPANPHKVQSRQQHPQDGKSWGNRGGRGGSNNNNSRGGRRGGGHDGRFGGRGGGGSRRGAYRSLDDTVAHGGYGSGAGGMGGGVGTDAMQY